MPVIDHLHVEGKVLGEHLVDGAIELCDGDLVTTVRGDLLIRVRNCKLIPEVVLLPGVVKP